AAEPFAQQIPDKSMNLLNIADRWRAPGTDRPDWLISHDHVAGSRSFWQREVELASADVHSLAGVALLLGFSDADDGHQARPPDRLGLLPHQKIALVMVGTPLGMANNDCFGAGIGQHLSGQIAGMRPRWLDVTILSADRKQALAL